MHARLTALCFRADDPESLARFWGGVLRRDVVDEGRGVWALAPADDVELTVRFRHAAGPKRLRNRVHVDLTSGSDADQAATVERVLALGGSHVDVGQVGDEGHVVLGDPDGNELCVIEPGNRFLAGCGPVGAVNSDGTKEVGRFWSEVLGWPLVWDQDEETAVQSPRGGSKVTWSGPPLLPKEGRNRLHLELAPPAGTTQEELVGHLLGLGARRASGRPADPTDPAGGVELTDADDNEFWVLPG